MMTDSEQAQMDALEEEVEKLEERVRELELKLQNATMENDALWTLAKMLKKRSF